MGARIVVTIVNRDVPFIYIKYKWKKWKGKTLPPRRPVHKVQCLLDWMMKKNTVKAAFQFASLDKSRYDGPQMYWSTAKQYFIVQLFENYIFSPTNEMNAKIKYVYTIHQWK